MEPTVVGTIPRIVVGVDGSANARAALGWALEEARLRHAALDVVHAWQLPFQGGSPVSMLELPADELERVARRVLDGAMAGADRTGLREVEALLICDHPARALLDTAKGADLLVVGSRGRGGFAGLLLGSVSQKILHHAPCPVVVIPPGTD
jgi:nucleotide-binding universal stress UspA family protein